MPAAPRSFDDKRARIAALAAAPPKEAVPELRRFLADKIGYLVGEAAKVTGELGLRELTPDLAAAFMRLLVDAGKSDKGCFGKNRVAEALIAIEADEPEVFLAGLRHTQPEPAFPEAIDTAAGLRGLCAHAVLHAGHPGALLEVAPLLADPEAITRAEAANALGNSGLDAAAALLHVKALTGDREPDVLGACYRGLLRIAPERYLPVVGRVLREGEPGDAEAAALALGESRSPLALPVLRDAIGIATHGHLRDSVLLGIALLRSDEATALLVSLVERGPTEQAAAAISALALHRHDPQLSERVRLVIEARGVRRLTQVFADRFGK